MEEKYVVVRMYFEKRHGKDAVSFDKWSFIKEIELFLDKNEIASFMYGVLMGMSNKYKYPYVECMVHQCKGAKIEYVKTMSWYNICHNKKSSYTFRDNDFIY